MVRPLERSGVSALSLVLLAQLAASCPAAPIVPPDRVAVTAKTESGLQTTALHDNTSGRSYLPASAAEAVALATALHAQGHSLDAGAMQVNDANWSRLGLTAETVFDPRANVCAGMTVLAEAYAVERRVSCHYNTGGTECRNGYPERIEAARVQLGLPPAAAPAAAPPVPAVPPGPPPPPSWDVWAQADYLDERAAAWSAVPAAPAMAPVPAEQQPLPPTQPEAQPATAAPAPNTTGGDGASSVAMVTGTPVRQ
jgi:type IV secretion system protein VirB1